VLGAVRGSYDGGVQNESSLRNALQVAWRRKWLIVLPIVLVPLVAVWVSLRQETLYEASSAVFLSHQNLALRLEGIDDPSLGQEPARIAQTQAELARSPIVANRTLAAADVTDRTWKDFLDRSEVSPRPNSDLLVFKVTDADPRLAIRLATQYGEQFTSWRRELDTAGLRAALTKVTTRIEELEAAGDRTSRLHASLVERQQQLETIQALETSGALVVRPANEAEQVQPQPVPAAFVGIALGINLGLALALVAEALDQRVRSPGEIEGLLGMPLLGRLPRWPLRLKRRVQPVNLARSSGVQAEAFRTLRARLLLVNLDHGARVIMLTSAGAGEGKSMTIANLATWLARAGAHVVLVDLDLRRPVINRLFGLHRQPGISDVVLGDVELEEALSQVVIKESEGDLAATVTENGQGAAGGVLEVLPSGRVPPDAGELAGSHAVAEILSTLRSRADFVLIDAPPLLQVGDAMALSAEVDALIVVVSQLKLSRRPMISELRRVLDSCPAKKLGFIITEADLDGAYRYGGSYRDRVGPRWQRPGASPVVRRR
jgi:succinoglycan biosynthesis transport protein ExoP